MPTARFGVSVRPRRARRGDGAGRVLLLGMAASCAAGIGCDSGALTMPDTPSGFLDAGAASDGSVGIECSSPSTASVPAQWVRPADCSGIGNSCAAGCGQGVCQVVGDICVPSANPSSAASSCGAYCFPFACVTFDEASCLCTNDAGVQYSQCACGPAALAGLCGTDGDPCGVTPCCSCQGLKCVTDAITGSACRTRCTKNSDCATNCCSTSGGVCQDSLYCTCADAGATCASGSLPLCCQGSTCVAPVADGGGGSTCAENCATSSDCQSGCCLPASPGQTQKVCGPCH